MKTSSLPIQELTLESRSKGNLNDLLAESLTKYGNKYKKSTHKSRALFEVLKKTICHKYKRFFLLPCYINIVYRVTVTIGLSTSRSLKDERLFLLKVCYCLVLWSSKPSTLLNSAKLISYLTLTRLGDATVCFKCFQPSLN